ncbi:MAG: SAM-dependent DNA methyltransferase [Anaerolineae bacterium]|nr:SAM-dependent DNA methyltransferase [Anaerolineae bacterium]
MPETAYLDAAFAVFKDRLGAAAHLGLSVNEPFASDDPVGVGGPLRTLTLRVQGTAFALLGLTVPTIAVDKAGLIEYLARRARARRIPYLIVSNLRDARLLPVPARPGDVPDPLKRYPPLYQIATGAGGSLSPPERISLADRADEIAADLAALHRDGSLDLVIPDADFFVGRLTRAVNVLKPAVKQALRTKLGMDPAFGQELGEWAVRQGIPADLRSEDFIEAVVRQAIYRLLGKIIFYQSLRRAAPHLPPMDLSGLDTGQVLPRLRDCFAAAHKIDYHAVFREDVVDRLPFPAAASAELRDLVSDLNTRDFAHLPQDVVGAVFERLIPPEDRHALGQYFTPEPLVDLIVAFCVRNADDTVLDPTCGTGTFLIRAYDRLRTRLGVYDHSRLLSQLWGVDIAPFPAELATINLFRQRVGDPGNFPRILNQDFFAIVPGGTYRFPPLKSGEGEGWIDEPIPTFDAIVGNFPYISADRIERTVKGYRQIVARRLTQDWFRVYPEGFTFKRNADEKQHRLARQNGLDLDAFLKKASPIISAYADLYVSLFWHAAAFLKEGGRMGIITSNAWLDVGYGYALQRFLLDHFKIVAILESRCEPWFLQAAVNTVVTIVERCSDPAERDAHPARFVKVKRPLAELIPWDLRVDALNRWTGLDGLVQRIEAVWQASDDPARPAVHEDDDFRIRTVHQGVLRQQVEAAGQTVKWGLYLRAPHVYFDLLRQAGDKLALLRDVAPPKFGSKTRINAFFHLDEETIQRWGIDSEFCWPLIKSPSETDTIRIDPDDLGLKVFVCRKTKDELRAEGKLGTLHYIEWGEQQEYKRGVQQGMKWPEGPWVKNRQPGWYALPESETHFSHLFFTQAYGDRHIQRYSPTPLVADARLYYLSPADEQDARIISAVLNSSLVAFLTELVGRVTLGDGVLELKVEDARDYLRVPDVRRFSQADRQAIVDAFQPLLARPIGSVFDEVKQPDRRALDAAVLRAMGLDPDRWLPRLYDGLTALVRERVQLGQMRGQARRSRPKRAANRVAEEVLQDLLPRGPARFPDDFFSPAARTGVFREIPLPAAPLRYAGPHFGQEQLTTEDGQTLTVANKFEVRYLLFAQAAGQKVARLPEKPVEVSRTVNSYVRYLRDLRQRLHDTYFTRTLDQAAAERFVGEVWRKLNLPEIEE